MDKIAENDTVKTISEQIAFLDKKIRDAYDSITKWVVDILDPLFQFAQGNWSAGDFIEHLPAVIKIMGIRALAKTAGGAISMLPSPAAKVVGGIISGGADAYLSVEALKGVKSYGNEIINRLQYGNLSLIHI